MEKTRKDIWELYEKIDLCNRVIDKVKDSMIDEFEEFKKEVTTQIEELIKNFRDLKNTITIDKFSHRKQPVLMQKEMEASNTKKSGVKSEAMLEIMLKMQLVDKQINSFDNRIR